MSIETIRVLLIEDNKTDVLIAKDELENEAGVRFVVDHREHLAGALLCLKTEPFDVVLLDLNLPDSEGMLTYDLLRAAQPTLPVVILSGRNDESLATEAVSAGAQDYLVKGRMEEHVLARAIRYAIERKRGEQSLRESEERFRATFEQSAVGIAHVAIDGRFLRVNDKLCELVGYKREELLELTFIELTIPEDRQEGDEALQAMLAGTRSHYNTEKRYRRKDGEMVWIRLVTTLARGTAGEPAYFISVMIDISERKQAETAQAEAVRFAQSTIDALSAHVCVLDEDGTILATNAAWRRFALENNSSTLPGRPGANYLKVCDAAAGRDASDARDFAAGLRAVIAGTKTEFVMEYSCHSETEKRWFVERISPFSGDRPIRVVVAHENITERKLAEEALRKSKEKLETIFEAAPLAIVGLDFEGRVTEWNSGAVRMFGWTVEEAVGCYSPIVPEDEKPAFEAMIKSVAAHGPRIGMIFKRQKKNGQLIQVSVSAAPVRDVAGTPIGIMAILEDITERKRMEEQFLRAQRLESIGTLASGIAHDLNNVLAPVLMAVEILKEKVIDDTARHILTTMESSAQHGSELVKQVLAFTRGMEGERIIVNPIHIMNDIAKIIRDTFPKNISFNFSPSRDLWTVTGDPTQLHQVFTNLCVNARDAMAQGGSLKVTMENLVLDDTYAGMSPESKPGAYVLVKVTDTGTGIPDSVRHRVFEPFFTTKEIGKGTGLGLSTTMAVVKSHGGFISLYSEVGKGTTFAVYLPAETAAKAVESKPVEQPRLPHGNGELVLVVDDEEAIRIVAQKTLERYGYSVMLASNGAEAIALFAEYRDVISIVLTDMAMPVMDGPATIFALKSMDPTVKIIGSSGLETNGSVAKSIGLGVNYFVSKPYTAETLLKKLAEALSQPA